VTASTVERLLVVSATIGEGHNATAAAVQERARQLWPGCQIRRVDTLELMGGVTGPAFRWIYRVNVDRTPWLYDFFYRELWRRPWFAAASCRFTGVWAAWALRPVLAEFRPDLVVSTYPIGTGGLDWLRRRGELDVPVAAFISDFAPHPFWVYSEIDLHYVASEPSLRAMRRARPDARGVVGAPPVVSAFQPADAAVKAAARRELGMPVDAPIALISCGSLGFGSVERAVDATLAAAPGVCAVVACGRNERLRHRLAARGEPAHRLVALGWTNRMPALTAAADVVITNAGGATALEALATGRTVLLFEPIAGHGKANAALMEQAGLGRVCPDPAALTAALAELVGDPRRLAEAERRVTEHIARLDFTDEVAALPTLPRHRGARPLAPADAWFVGATTDQVPQQLGAVIMLDPAGAQSAPAPEEIAAGLRERWRERAGELPALGRRLEPRRGRRPRWMPAEVDPAAHIADRVLAPGITWAEAVRELVEAPLPRDRPPWRLTVLREPGERVALVAALHHSLGDGLAVTATLAGLVLDRPPADGGRQPGEFGSRPLRARVRDRWARVGRLVTGLAELATTGRAAVGRSRPSSPTRDYAFAELAAAPVRAAARGLGVGTTALLLGLLGEALHRHGPPVPTRDGRLRTAVPLTIRRVRRPSSEPAGARSGDPGNATAAVMLDLPVGPMPAGRRIAEVAEAMRRASGPQSVASAFVVRAVGRLPSWLHLKLARLVYGGRFFSLIASVLPGLRRPSRVLGRPLRAVYPVLPLADRVGLAVGFLSWGDVLAVGVTADRGMFPDADGFAKTVAEVFAELAGEPAPGLGGEPGGRE
jgi:UDP-N-acetylglucosamine:LPS N-acetylglucosamine transferase